MHFPWSHKLHDYVTAALGPGMVAVLSLTEIEAGLQILLLLLSIVFVLLGIVMRSERFVRRVARVLRGEPMKTPAEEKEDREDRDEGE